MKKLSTKETREVKGEVEGWSQEPRDFHSNNMGSRGVKIEGDWHNVLDKMDFLETLNEVFTKGSFIKFTEEKNARGYWDVKGDIEKIEKAKAYENNTALPKESNVDRNKDILFQVAFKGAIKTMEVFFKKSEITDLDDLCKYALSTTEKLYLGLKEKKLKLQEKGEW